jgi:outer membrane protein, heavy metal efflux system
MRRIIVILSLTAFCIRSNAQSGLENVLNEIERNNKSLQTEKRYWEAQRLSYLTGLNPENPKVEYDYMIGSPADAGNQTDMSVSQAFDFPTSYSKRKGVSREQIQQSEYQFSVTRQEILFQAKVYCLELIHRNKLQNEFSRRLLATNQLVQAITRKTSQGESSILDLNKIKLLQLDVKNNLELNVTAIKTLQQKLREMNGDTELDLEPLTYPLIQDMLTLETLDSLIEANDPIVKVFKQEKNITAEQLALSRSLTLPKLEAGYHYQAILGQKYQGFHVGTSIPLWENKNKVNTQQARLSHSDFQIQEHRIQHLSRNKQNYEKYLHWKNTVDEYQALLTTSNNEELLTKSLEHGQSSLIEYLMEMRYFYDAIDKYLDAERELHYTIAELYKFQL